MNAARPAPELDPAVFSPLDRHFAQLMARLAGGDAPELTVAAALISHGSGEGHVCLDLRDASAAWATAELPAPTLPEPDRWLARLRESPVVGAPGEFKPLILDAQGRLYLHRYWEYETRLAAALRARAAAPVPELNLDLLRDGLQRFYPGSPPTGPDWQQVAALAALRHRVCVISGGPGTGKTHTVVVLLALLLEQAGEAPVRIALTAPTGKAAARLQESVQRLKPTLRCAEAVRDRLPAEASTLHRLLGAFPGSASFRHHAKNPLPLDVLVVDEASMVDLALMSKLFDALPGSARVILLGDKDQLASVEAGAVLGDICSGQRNEFSAAFTTELEAATGQRVAVRPGSANPALADGIVQLERNHRFAPGSGILELSQAVNRGEAGAALEILGRAAGVRRVDVPDAAHLKKALRPAVLEGYRDAVTAREPMAALASLGGFRILAALRRGPYGVEHLNQVVVEILGEAGWIDAASLWYAGRAVMVTENDPGQRLFNGDTGVALPDETGQVRVYFPAAEGGTRALAPARLPRHETAFALTVHKSQGSEFGRVLLMLPDHDSRVLTRELIYTGVTRAREEVAVWLNEPVFRRAVERRVERASGLREALWI